MRRAAREIVDQAIIYGALGFRASLEVTEHPRSKNLCSQLLPWLEQCGLGAKIEEHHREILETPHKELPSESQTEAFWRGEAASVLGWAVQLFDKPDPTEYVDAALLVTNLKILLPTAEEIANGARLRSQSEIDNYCAYCMIVRHQHQLSAFPEEMRATLSAAHQARLATLGLCEAYKRLDGADLEAATRGPKSPGVKGLYVVRGLTTEWLLGGE